jgi:hypothetical protein
MIQRKPFDRNIAWWTATLFFIATISASTETLAEEPVRGVSQGVSDTHLRRSHNTADLEYGLDTESENGHGSALHHQPRHVVVVQEGSPHERDWKELAYENFFRSLQDETSMPTSAPTTEREMSSDSPSTVLPVASDAPSTFQMFTSDSPASSIVPSTPPVSEATGKKAMTWRVISNYTSSGHNYHLFGSDEVTDAYSGDTDVRTTQALLCIKKLNLPLPLGMPATHITSGGALKGSWSGGRAAMLPQVRGSEIHSLQAANELCRSVGLEAWKEDGFRMAEFHDGDQTAGIAGWDFWAEVPESFDGSGLRFWVHINDQPANLW